MRPERGGNHGGRHQRCGIVCAMAVRRCPKCGLINPETATACDCGWSFVRAAMGAPLQLARSEDELRRERRSHANGQLAIGGGLLLLGILITAVTYGSASSGGGTYIIAYGPMILGVIKIIRGLAGMSS